MSTNITPILWLDLDGTVRHGKDELGYFATQPEQVVLFEGVPEILYAYREAGWRIAGVSNQGGIAMGHLTLKDCQSMMARTQELSGGFDLIAFCPHHPDAEYPLMCYCWCRKPYMGMLVKIMDELEERHQHEVYCPPYGLFVGDRPEDEACAANAGVPFMPAAAWRGGGWRKVLERCEFGRREGGTP